MSIEEIIFKILKSILYASAIMFAIKLIIDTIKELEQENIKHSPIDRIKQKMTEQKIMDFKQKPQNPNWVPVIRTPHGTIKLPTRTPLGTDKTKT